MYTKQLHKIKGTARYTGHLITNAQGFFRLYWLLGKPLKKTIESGLLANFALCDFGLD